MRTWIGLAVGAVAVAALGSCARSRSRDPESKPSATLAQPPAQPGPRSACPVSAWPIPSGSGTPAPICPPQGCGTNGAWLGREVPFHELHLGGAPNRQHLRITGFKTRVGDAVGIDVVGDVLSGVHPALGRLTGRALEGSKLSLRDDHNEVDYTLTLEHVIDSGFWTACHAKDPAECTGAPSSTPVYQFSATNSKGECVELCQPGLTTDYDALYGNAVIFRGDRYDDDRPTVSIPDSAPGGPDADLFNIACVGTAISKLHLLRHTTASEDPAHLTTIAQRQTLLRMLAGDYCGTGRSFTEDGHPLRYDFTSPRWQTIPAIRPGAEVMSVDARWTAAGASCIGTPRLADERPRADVLREITAECGKPLPACAPIDPAAPLPAAAGDYAISANSFR